MINLDMEIKYEASLWIWSVCKAVIAMNEHKFTDDEINILVKEMIGDTGWNCL